MTNANGQAVDDGDPTDGSEPTGTRLLRLGTRLIVVAGIAALALMLFKLAPEQIPLKRDPGFIDIIFASRTVVAAVRALILFASIYAALSLIALIWSNRWITSFAGVQTSKVERSVSGLDQERDRLARELEESKGTIHTLEDDLAQALETINQLSMDLDTALADVDDLRNAGSGGPLGRLKRWRRGPANKV
jgi:hypothetical protein